MKAVILAAGEGRRMRPLTDSLPKPMIRIHGKPILEYSFNALPDEIDEVVLVVRHLRHEIEKYFGTSFNGKKISYAEGSHRGTAYSFLAARSFFSPSERLLLMYGDEIPNPHDVVSALEHDHSAVVFHSSKPQTGGVVVLDQDNYIQEIEEKPTSPKTDIVVDGIVILNADIFDIKPEMASGEFYLTAMLNQFVKRFNVKGVFSEGFLGDITNPEDIKRVELLMSKQRLY